MRRAVAALAVVLFLASDARAQAPALRLDPAQAATALQAATAVQAEIASQSNYSASAVLALCMSQMAAAGNAPNQADIDEAARQYLTNAAAVAGVPSTGPAASFFENGAAVTAPPSSGPGSEYFHNGAEATGYYLTSRPGVASGAGDAGISTTSQEGGAPREAASVPTAAPEAPPATGAPVPSGRPAASSATGLTCPPEEIEAAMAIASGFARANAQPPSPPPPSPSVAPVPPPSCEPTSSAPPPVVAAPAAASGPAASRALSACPPRGGAFGSRLALAFAGALFGGLVVGLWGRSRRPRGPPPRARAGA